MQFPIYLDHSATTPLDPKVLEAMLPYFTESYGNPATLYNLGMMANEAVTTAREEVANVLCASPDEIYFTSGGTESDNTCLLGVQSSFQDRSRHILTSPIEHHAISAPLERLTTAGYEIETLPVGKDGIVDLREVEKRLRKDTLLITVMHANNEIGSVQYVQEIGALCRERGVLFHTDAVQSFGKLPIDVRAMNIDMLSISAHKLYGPKGVGAMYIRRGTPLNPFQLGGEQEHGRRAGTLNVPGIVGLGKAALFASRDMESEIVRLSALRDWFITSLENSIPCLAISGSRSRRLSNNVHICVEGVAGESMLLALDAAGICAAAGSACSTGATEPSHVLKAIGIPRELAQGALRLTLGKSTNLASLEFTLDILSRTVFDLRKLSGTFQRYAT